MRPSFITEAIVVGLAMVVVGALVSFVVRTSGLSRVPAGCQGWNDNHVMEISLFVTGMMTHMMFELVGANRFYTEYTAAAAGWTPP